ncbi:MAG: iron-containing alcohol dehydrogenase [Cohaesibacter sp.]|nr:iron-containing alcohol dehydrogenase [Cohaesibacter sp.]
MFVTPITFALPLTSRLFPPQKPLLFSGANSSLKLADFMVRNGSKRPLVVTDSFLHENGMLDDLLAFLKQSGCEVTIFDGIIPNPTFAVVEAGLEASRANQCDAVFAVGGGSAIDAAKVMAAASTSKKSIAQLAGILKVDQPLLPFYVAPTTSGTGSEVTSAAVISDSKTHKKKFFVDPKYIPIAAALDTELLKSLPAPMTAATGMDALTHAIEAYICRNRFEDTDRDAAMAIKLLVEFLPIACADGENEQAREMTALGSFLAGFAFTKASLGYVHAISHQISAHYNTPHGLANAVILPRVLRFNKVVSKQRFAALERMLSPASTHMDDHALANNFIDRIDALSETVNIPPHLEELKSKDFDAIAHDAISEARWSYAVPKVMSKKDVIKILTSASNGNRSISF